MAMGKPSALDKLRKIAGKLNEFRQQNLDTFTVFEELAEEYNRTIQELEDAARAGRMAGKMGPALVYFQQPETTDIAKLMILAPNLVLEAGVIQTVNKEKLKDAAIRRGQDISAIFGKGTPKLCVKMGEAQQMVISWLTRV